MRPSLPCTEWRFNGPCALDADQQSVYLGQQIIQYNPEQHLFLPTRIPKSNVSIVLAAKLFANESCKISINSYLNTLFLPTLYYKGDKANVHFSEYKIPLAEQ